MEKEYSVVVLDGVEYTVIDRLEYDDNSYVLLSNFNDPTDFCIKKVIIEDGEEYIKELENEEEFKNILTLIGEKY